MIISTIIYMFACLVAPSSAVRNCGSHEIDYVMTECDSKTNHMFRLAVPSVQDCTISPSTQSYVPIPCDHSCEAGQYLDMEGDKRCVACPPGTYSLGSGIRHDDWSGLELPSDFTIDRSGVKIMNEEESAAFCNTSMWTPAGDFLVSNNDECHIKLFYMADLNVNGAVEFEYQYSDSSLHFHFYVVDENCGTPTGNSIWPETTTKGNWKTIRANLTAGHNKLFWSVYAVPYMTSKDVKPKPVLIRSISVLGLAFAEACTKCPPGYYQDQSGQSRCKACAPNSYAAALGATQCVQCNADEEYSLYGSQKCEPRPKCSESDYYKFHDKCKAGQTVEKYAWIDPKICRGDVDGAVQLPESGNPTDCPACNPGMQSNGTHCNFCPPTQYSDGNSPCKNCPAGTEPVTKIQLEYWDEIPPNTDIYCFSVSGKGCPIGAAHKGDVVPPADAGTGWKLANDVIETNLGNADDTVVVLEMYVPEGFKGGRTTVGGRSSKVGTVTFVFETRCDPPDSKCTLFFASETDNADDFNVINFWEGSQNKQSYSFVVTSTLPQTFTWAFQKSVNPELEGPTFQYKSAQLKIHSIEITNSRVGGAVECSACEMKKTDTHGQCIGCPKGQFWSAEDSVCLSCPADYIVNPLSTNSTDRCIACGPGMTSEDGVTCKSTCNVTTKEGRTLNFDRLNTRVGEAKTAPMFSASGAEYFQYFKMGLCGDAKTGLGAAECTGNLSRVAYQSDESMPQDKVTGFVCRSLLVPHEGSLYTDQPVLLADELVAVTEDREYLGHKVLFEESPFMTDVHFYYLSFQQTLSCEAGRSVIVTVRCDPDDPGVQFETNSTSPSSDTVLMPTKCPQGTCDGCHYNFMRLSRDACPVCDEWDIEEIPGECILGEQTVRYTWKNGFKTCVDGTIPKPIQRRCNFLNRDMKIALSIGLLTTIVLTVVSCHYQKKTKKLEYKYQKLVNNTSADGTTNFAPVESCGVDDDDDEEEVAFYKDQRSFIGKLRVGAAVNKAQLSSDDEARTLTADTTSRI